MDHRTGTIPGRAEGLRFSLRDGSAVLLRPIRPDDKRLLREGFKRLSVYSRYRRFMTPLTELSESQLAHFTEIDYRDHMAWIALDAGSRHRKALGTARYIRLEKNPTKAEVAVTVVDSHQGLGLGTLLLGVLSRSAAECGVETFVAYVLVENEPMLSLFRELGARVGVEDQGVVRVEVPVPEDLEQVPDSPAGRAFRMVGAHWPKVRHRADEPHRRRAAREAARGDADDPVPGHEAKR